MEELYRQMAEEAPVLIWASRPDKGCGYVNRGWREFTGRTVDQALGDGWVERVHRDDVDGCLAAYDWACGMRPDFRMEYRLQRKDGAYRRVSEWGVAHVDGQGTFDGYVALCLDVTDRAEAEQTLKKSQALSYAAFASLPGHVAVMGKDGRLIAVNEAWVQFGRANGAELETTGIGADYPSVCRRAAAQGDRDAQAALQGVEAVLTGKRERFVWEYPCHAPGSERWFDLMVHPLKSPVKGAILSHLNVTKRHLAETFVRYLAQENQEKAEGALQSLIRRVKRASQ